MTKTKHDIIRNEKTIIKTAEAIYGYYTKYVKSPHTIRSRSLHNIKKVLLIKDKRILMRCLRNYIDYINHKGTETKFIIGCQNFFNLKEVYLDYEEAKVPAKLPVKEKESKAISYNKEINKLSPEEIKAALAKLEEV